MEVSEIIARICQDVFTHPGPLPAVRFLLLSSQNPTFRLPTKLCNCVGSLVKFSTVSRSTQFTVKGIASRRSHSQNLPIRFLSAQTLMGLQLLKSRICVNFRRCCIDFVQACSKVAGWPLGLVVSHQAKQAQNLFVEFKAEIGLMKEPYQKVGMDRWSQPSGKQSQCIGKFTFGCDAQTARAFRNCLGKVIGFARVSPWIL